MTMKNTAPTPPQLRRGDLSSKLKFWDLYDGVIFLEDNRLEVALEFTPPGALFAQPDADWVALKTVLKSAIPEGERARIIVESTASDGGRIADYRGLKPEPEHTVAAVIDSITTAKADQLEAARRAGQVTRWRYFVSCTISQLKKRTRGLSFSPEELRHALNLAQTQRERLFSTLSSANYQPQSMNDQAIFELIWRYLNPGLVPGLAPRFLPYMARAGYLPDAELREHPVHHATFSRQVANSSIDVSDPHHVSVGDRYIKTISFCNMPEETTPGCLRRLMQGAAESGQAFYLVLDFKHQRHGPKLRKLEEQVRRYYAAANATNMPPNPAAEVALEDTKQVLRNLTTSGDHVYTAAITAVLCARSLGALEHAKEQVTSAFNAYPGSLPVTGPYQTLASYFASVPLSGQIGEFVFETVESNAADLLPAVAPWDGHLRPVMLMRNRWGSLTALDTFDDRLTNFNAYIAATSGWGKTFLNQHHIASLQRIGAEVFIVDQKKDFAPLVEALGGKTIAFGPDSGVAINIFDLDHGEHKPTDTKRDFILTIIRQMIGPTNDPQAAAIEETILLDNINKVYTRRRPGEPITLSDFRRALDTTTELAGKQMNKTDLDLAHSLSTRLYTWSREMPLGKMFDAPTNVNLEGDLMYFDISALAEKPKLSSVAMMLISDIIWRRAMRDPNRPSLALLEEFWGMLGTPEARALAERLFRLARTYKLAAWATSQSLDDAKVIPALLECIKTFYIGQVGSQEAMAMLRETLKLGESAVREYETLTRIRGKFSEWMVVIEEGGERKGEILKLEPNPFEYWMYTTHANDKVRREAALKQHGSVIAAVSALAGEVAT